MNLRFYVCCCFILLIVHTSKGQVHTEALSFEQLEDSILKYNYRPDFINRHQQKAILEQDTLYQARSFYYKLVLADNDTGMKITDSILRLTRHFKHKVYPALGYMLKGHYLYEKGLEKEAHHQFLIAYKFALEQNNIHQQVYCKRYIGDIKTNLGLYKEAIDILKEQYALIQTQPSYLENYKDAYIDILGSVSNAYLRSKDLDSALHYINKGLIFCKQPGNNEYYYEFIDKRSFYYYFKKDYDKALDGLIESEPFQTTNTDLAMNYYYRGKIHQIRKEHTKAFRLFTKVDSLYHIAQNPFLELKDVYKTLYDYYYDKNDGEQQLYSINQLIAIDSILTDAKINVSSESTQQYEIPELKKEKERLTKELYDEYNKSHNFIFIVSALLLLLTGLFLKLYYDKKQLKTRFESIIQKQDTNSKSVVDKPIETPSEKTENTLNISQEVIDAILETLTQFEHNNGYLNNDITLRSLAKQFHTNSVYLSKTINHYKGVSLSTYLNNLRIDHCVFELKRNIILRNYTIKAIAIEMGFRNAESFSKAFKKQTGLNPSYYIKELNKLEKNS
jgi:AraC-like DNA-binding protein